MMVEDPTIASTARACHADMLQELQKRYAKGEPYFRVRDEIMAREGPAMARLYGKDTAKRALAALTSYGPQHMPKDVIMAACDCTLARIERNYHETFGGDWRFTRWQRFLFRHTGHLGLFSTEPVCKGGQLFGSALDEHRAAVLRDHLDRVEKLTALETARVEAERVRRHEEKASRQALNMIASMIERDQRALAKQADEKKWRESGVPGIHKRTDFYPYTDRRIEN